ncbi:MAG TPA: MopE-related protein [Chitinophagales bacterium]|nr:MopE-related protein [Chitinophagales bacterium]
MRKIYLLLTMALVCVFSVSKAQVYAYLDDPTGAYAGVATNASGTNLSRYNGLESDPACGVGFSSIKHTTSGYSNNRPGVQFTVTPDAGFQLNITSISVDVRRNPKGPQFWRIAYSTDGGTTWTNSGVDATVASSGCFSSTNVVFDVADFSTTSTLTVRIIGHTAYSSLNGISTLKNIDVAGTVSFADADGDGYTSDVDCNDADAAINPGATEICNGMDDNCNGDIDEGAGATWYADADGDTYGDAASTTVACDMPEGYVADATDCNDADAAVNPGATEVCNGVDDNCDGNIDEGLTFETWYADADGDMYGDAGASVSTCDGAPAGYVADAADCNDADAAVNPGATEVCNGIDDNCDGNIDEGIDLSIAISPDGVITLCKPDAITLEATAGFTSYQWYKNGSPLAGETGATYTTNKPAYYQVEGFIGTCTSGLSAVQAVAVVESPNANISTPDGTNLCIASPLLIKASYDAAYTYVWYKDGIEIAGATTAEIDATETGDYYCVITNASGCTRTTATVTIINECRLGVADAAGVNLYPNPASSSLVVSLTGIDAENAIIAMVDVMGNTISTSSVAINSGNGTATIDVSAVAAGVYFITVQGNDVILNQQIVVTK